MPRLSNDDQFKFLISCIRYSNNGKVDFTEVAKECNIVSKGAAAKRYERMMKAHGIHQGRETYSAAAQFRDESETPVQAPKKRKQDEPGLHHSQSSPQRIEAMTLKKEDGGQTYDHSVVKTEHAPIVAHGPPPGIGYPPPDCFPFLNQPTNVGPGHLSFDDIVGTANFEHLMHPSVYTSANAPMVYGSGQMGHPEGLRYPEESQEPALGDMQSSQGSGPGERIVVVDD